MAISLSRQELYDLVWSKTHDPCFQGVGRVAVMPCFLLPGFNARMWPLNLQASRQECLTI